MRSVGHSLDLRVPYPYKYIHDDITAASGDIDEIGKYAFDCKEILQYKPFTHSELIDLVRDLGFTKEKAKLRWSRLKEKNMWSYLSFTRLSILLRYFRVDVSIQYTI